MKFLFMTLFTTIITFSCSSDSRPKDLSGNYEDIDNYAVTKIERIDDIKYLIISPDGKFKIPFEREGNNLVGSFEGMKISCEFNSTFDTIVNKSNGKVMFTCKKQVNR